MCFFFFKDSLKSSPARWITLVCFSSQAGSGGGGASGLEKEGNEIGLKMFLEAGKGASHPGRNYQEETEVEDSFRVPVP